jgi:S1-C subfamily serine protease
MKTILIFLSILLSLSFKSFSKEIYFFSTSTGLVQNVRVRIYNGKDFIGEIRELETLKIDVGNINSYELTFKSYTYFTNKKVKIDFTKKEIAFVKINLEDFAWSVYEVPLSFTPASIYNEITQRILDNLLQERIKKHPKSNWSELTLNNYFKENTKDIIEGIYEQSFRSDNFKRKFKLGVKLIDNVYNLIYIKGSEKNYWVEGDIKGVLQPTATNNLFKVLWYDDKKIPNDDVLITFENGLMSVTFSGSTTETFLKIFPLYVPNSSQQSSGTGFAISSDGLIVTNHHIISERKNISVKGVNGDYTKAYKASIVLEDKNNDISIIRISDQSIKISAIPFVINNNISEVGTSVFVLGYPLRATMGDEIKLTNGIISSKSGFMGDITSYQISVPVQPGNSGGPLFDLKGNLIGIVSAKHLGTENVSYSIKSTYLLNLLQMLHPSPKLNTHSKLMGKELPEQVSMLKEFVYIIEAE